MKETPWVLEREHRLPVLQAIVEVCRYRQWTAHAVHVRSTYIHAVIGGMVKPERILCGFEAYATRALRSAAGSAGRRRYWAYHGSTPYLWNQSSLKAAIDYVLDRGCLRVRLRFGIFPRSKNLETRGAD